MSPLIRPQSDTLSSCCDVEVLKNTSKNRTSGISVALIRDDVEKTATWFRVEQRQHTVILRIHLVSMSLTLLRMHQKLTLETKENAILSMKSKAEAK